MVHISLYRVLISGIQKFTLLDFPNKTACVVFTPGCNFRCGYCHNPEFVLPEKIQEIKGSFIPEEAFFSFLNDRRGLLDGVVVTGGEPTLMPDLLPFMKRIKSLGLLVKLDTNGNRPEILKAAVSEGAIDYVSMDVKTSLEGYPGLVGKLVKPEKIKESVDFLLQNTVDYEFRSTLIKESHSIADLENMVELVRGAKRIFLQSFRSGITLSPIFGTYHPFSEEEMRKIASQFGKTVAQVEIR